MAAVELTHSGTKCGMFNFINSLVTHGGVASINNACSSIDYNCL